MDNVNSDSDDNYHEADRHRRGIKKSRRITLGRRKMIRFDYTGGDRRSGNARRIEDEGFQQESP